MIHAAPAIHAGLPQSHRQRAQLNAAAAMRMTALAAPYMALSNCDEDGIYWRFARGAFDQAAQAPCKLWVCHSTKIELCHSSTGMLTLRSEFDGLYIDFTLPSNQAGHDARLAIGRGHIKGVSVGFANPVEREFMEHGVRVREISRASLREISLATTPRFRQTWIRAAPYRDQIDRDETRRIEKFFQSL